MRTVGKGLLSVLACKTTPAPPPRPPHTHVRYTHGHCTLHTAHCTLHTTHNTHQHDTRHVLCSVCRVLWTVYYGLCTLDICALRVFVGASRQNHARTIFEEEIYFSLSLFLSFFLSLLFASNSISLTKSRLSFSRRCADRAPNNTLQLLPPQVRSKLAPTTCCCCCCCCCYCCCCCCCCCCC